VVRRGRRRSPARWGRAPFVVRLEGVHERSEPPWVSWRLWPGWRVGMTRPFVRQQSSGVATLAPHERPSDWSGRPGCTESDLPEGAPPAYNQRRRRDGVTYQERVRVLARRPRSNQPVPLDPATVLPPGAIRGTAGTRQKERPHGGERPAPYERTRRSRQPIFLVRRRLGRPVHGVVDDDPRVRPGAGSDRSQPPRLCAIRILGLGGPPWRSSTSAASDPVGASLPSPAAPVP
jgi:hypothetical protein